MAWYSAGSVQVTNNSNAVTGTGTDFIANTRVGDGFLGPDGRLYQITNASSATSLSISPNYLGTTAGAQPYKIIPVQGYNAESARLMREIIVNWGTQLSSIQPWAYAPTEAAARDALDVPSNSEIDTRLGTTGNLGTAAQANVTTSATDTASGRVWRTNDLVKTTSTSDKVAGRILRVGDGGIVGDTTDIPASPGFADWTAGGLWRVRNDDPGIPFANAYYLIHNNRQAANASQILHSDSNRLLSRVKSASVWSAFTEYWSSANQLAIGTTAASARAAIDSSVLPPYTVSTVPSAAANPNKLIVVTNAAAGRNSYLSDGTNWRNPDRVILS